MWLYVSVIVGIAIVVAAVVVSFVRWFFIRPRRMKLPEGSIEELNRFAQEFRRAAEYMNELSKTLELRSLLEWQRKNEEILKTLHQMNRLLKELNEFFEVEATELGQTDSDEDAQAPEGSPSGRPLGNREGGRGGRRSL
jgi:hypothetical protein